MDKIIKNFAMVVATLFNGVGSQLSRFSQNEVLDNSELIEFDVKFLNKTSIYYSLSKINSSLVTNENFRDAIEIIFGYKMDIYQTYIFHTEKKALLKINVINYMMNETVYVDCVS